MQTEAGAVAPVLAAARSAQTRWAATTVQQRLQIIKKLRQEIAADPAALAATVPTSLPGALHRSVADTLVAEVLPLLEACRFLEREAAFLLRPVKESAGSRPAWLRGVMVETRREPLGVVLILAPANYPLFLAGVQALQALVAGNAVLWKPAPGTAACAYALARQAVACGLDPALLTILDPDPHAVAALIHAGPGLAPDKVILTGAAATGRAVLRQLAETLTPAAMELSGCDAVFVFEGADLARLVEALTFALRLNGSATCMAPRRLFVTDTVAEYLVPHLITSLDSIPATPLTPQTRALLRDLVDEATLFGATLPLDGFDVEAEETGCVYGTLLDHVSPSMRVAQSDIFAPVLSILRVADTAEALAAHRACPYALTAAIFGPVKQAEALAAQLHAGTVLINDLVVPTADPRASFAGRGESGFGATRGREGLLGMTQVKTILRQRGSNRRAYQTTGAAHLPFFAGFAQMLHAGPWRTRIAGLKQLIASAKHVK